MALSNLTAAQKEDLVLSLAVLLLHDSNQAVTKDNIQKVVDATGITVQGYWSSLYAKLLDGRDLEEILLKPGFGGGAAAPAATGAAGGAAAAPAAAAESSSESEEEADLGGAGGLFGGGSDSD